MNTVEDNQSFLGQGWAFPLHFYRESGTVNLASQEEDVEQSLLILLQTRLGERAMRPNWGASPQDMIFETLNVTTANLMLTSIEKAIREEEPRVEVISTDITPRIYEGAVDIEIDYRIISTNSRYNLVYPFYINEAPLSN